MSTLSPRSSSIDLVPTSCYLYQLSSQDGAKYIYTILEVKCELKWIGNNKVEVPSTCTSKHLTCDLNTFVMVDN